MKEKKKKKDLLRNFWACIFLDHSQKSSVLCKNIRKWEENELQHRPVLNVFQNFQICDGITLAFWAEISYFYSLFSMTLLQSNFLLQKTNPWLDLPTNPIKIILPSKWLFVAVDTVIFYASINLHPLLLGTLLLTPSLIPILMLLQAFLQPTSALGWAKSIYTLGWGREGTWFLRCCDSLHSLTPKCFSTSWVWGKHRVGRGWKERAEQRSFLLIYYLLIYSMHLFQF